MASGEMVELTAASGDIDCTDQIEIFEGFQKAFVVNGANLKVIDFINKKIVLTAGMSDDYVPRKGEEIYQNTATDPASVLVDFVADSTTIYGFVTGGVLETAKALTDVDGNTVGTVDTITAYPHWYDWEPQYLTSTTTLGSMPNKAYLGCLYRGRCVLAGDPDNPYTWYMSRQANPWDWAYAANDAQSPVAGSNADAGQLGDIITALIPYRDDYLIFGCSSSMWVMRGDPAAGGAINCLSTSIGIFGAGSWCWGDGERLYFWGNRGLCAIDLGPTAPASLSDTILPNINKDWGLDWNQHTVNMVFDKQRGGILINKVLLADGTNECLWFDLKTQGFFPESYSSAHAPFSSLFYDAADPDYRGVIFGCTDGYLRTFDSAQKDDDDVAINSHAVIGPIRIQKQEDSRGRLQSLAVVTGGGDTGGTQEDTDSLNYGIYTGDSAEEVMEKIESSSPLHSGSVAVPGRIKKIRARSRGSYMAVRLNNSVVDESWIFEKMTGDIVKAGEN